ncbi:MAG: hypothetical protein JNK47_12890 [Mesorhizobium sp.]|nr:hypothetical protein [Mesorhizobium sp.]MBL8578116.1 hypothetical protein [Mesorhizobium sp.]
MAKDNARAAPAKGAPVNLTVEEFREALWEIIADIEGDMFQVSDHALLIHDKLIQRTPISQAMKNALSWPASDLLDVGARLREHFASLDNLYRNGPTKGGDA